MSGQTRVADKRYLVLALGAVLVLLLGVVAVGTLTGGTLRATPTAAHDPVTLKTDSALLDLVQAFRLGGAAEAQRFARDRGLLTGDDQVRLILVLDSTDTTKTVSALQEMGATVETAQRNLVKVTAPLSLIFEKSADLATPGFFDTLAGLARIVDVRLPGRLEPDGAEPLSQGVALTSAAKWHAQGFKGKGVKVGIIDLGFKGYQSLLGIGLPQTLTAKSFISDGDITGGGEPHGTAVAEIVYEMAPEAELFLANVETDADWLAAVDWLVSQGVRVISQSLGDVDSPFDGSGSRAKRIDELRAKGILWVNSAGNYAQQHYTATLKPDADGWHQFEPGRTRMRVVPGSSGALNLTLNWRDWESRNIDYDLYVFNANDEVVASSRNVQAGYKYPVEWVYFYTKKGESYSVGVKAKDPGKILPFDLFNVHGLVEFAVAKGSLAGYGTAKGALTVGATNWKTEKLEPYSSQGPTWDGRMKPEITAPASVASLVYGQGGFSGTSASAPHVAGAAALILGANPGYTVAQLIQHLEQNAVDLGSIGLTVKDSRFGYGRLDLGPPPKR